MLEQEECGKDNSTCSSFTTPKSEEPTNTGEQAAPPNLPFREFVQRVREFLFTPDPAGEEHYKPGLTLGRLLLQTAQNDAVKPSTSSTLDIGKFPSIPPHKCSWYNVVDEKYS